MPPGSKASRKRGGHWLLAVDHEGRSIRQRRVQCHRCSAIRDCVPRGFCRGPRFLCVFLELPRLPWKKECQTSRAKGLASKHHLHGRLLSSPGSSLSVYGPIPLEVQPRKQHCGCPSEISLGARQILLSSDSSSFDTGDW
ncbi:hypothetical protein MRX96_042700 [Rhipicephalus microplus]